MKTKIEIAKQTIDKYIKVPVKTISTKEETMYVSNAIQACVDSIIKSQEWILIEDELPELKQIVIAKCEFSTGEISHNIITRIPTKESIKGWQWSGERMNSYFTLKVISWRPLELK